MIEAQQVQYTSCRFAAGKSGGMGLRVRTYSEGLSEEALSEIIPWCGYRRPYSLEESVDGEVDLSRYPVSFNYFRLSDGRGAVTLTHYAGRDYSNRSGNFFSHTLVFDPKCLALPPVSLLAWDGWKKRLDPKDDEREPDKLRPATIDTSSLWVDGGAQRCASFLAADPARAEAFRDILAAVLLYPTSHRSVVIRDNGKNGSQWIMCVQVALPSPWVIQLPLSSYRFDYTKAAVQCTTPDTGFSFGEAERESHYVAFDMVEGLRSSRISFDEKADEEARGIADLISRWLVEDSERLEGFKTFARSCFEARSVGVSAFKWMTAAYRLTTEEKLPFRWEELPEFLSFLTDNGRRDALEPLAEILEPLPILAPREMADRAWVALIEFYASLSAVGDELFAQRAFSLWIESFKEAARSDGATVRMLLAVLGNLEAGFPNSLGNLHSEIMEGGFLKAIEGAAGLAPDLPGNLLDTLLKALSASYEPLFRTSSTIEFLLRKMLSARGTFPSMAIDYHGRVAQAQEMDSFWKLCAQAAGEDRGAREEAAVGLGRVMMSLGQEDTVNLYECLFEHDLGDLLLEAWIGNFDGQGDKAGYYLDFEKNILAVLEDFKAFALPRISQVLCGKLLDKQRGEILIHWLKGNFLEVLPPDVKNMAIRVGNEAIEPWSGASGDDLIQIVRRAASKARLTLQPNNPALVRAMEALYENGPLNGIELSSELYCGIERNAYAQYLRKAFVAWFRKAGGDKEHRLCFEFYFFEPHADIFFKLYAKAVHLDIGGGALATLMLFWLGMERGEGVACHTFEHRERILDSLSKAAVALDRSDWEGFLRCMSAGRGPLTIIQDKEWEERIEQIKRARRPLKDKILSGVNSVIGVFSGGRD